MTTVYRIQPQGAELHAVQSESSIGQRAKGVHVFSSLTHAYGCREWVNEQCVELATVECSASDLIPNGDYEGVTLKSGCGRIVKRQKFDDVTAIAEWIESHI